MSSGRDDILIRLRAALGRTSDRTPRIDAPRPSAPMTVTEAHGDRRQLAARFGESLVALSGSYETVTDATELAGRAAERIRAWSEEDRRSGDADRLELLSWASEQLTPADLGRRLELAGITLVVPDELHDRDVRQRAAALRLGLTGVDAAIASTGSAVIAAGPGRSRAASLLPTHHLMIVPSSRIYPTPEHWFAELRRDGHHTEWLRRSGQIVFISGPSKSADIELSLTLGVHGPRVVHAIIYDDVEP